MKKIILEYLNDGWIDEHEYLKLYNHFAVKTNTEQLTTTEDIYTEKNRQNDLISCILNAYDPFYNQIYLFVIRSVIESKKEE